MGVCINRPALHSETCPTRPTRNGLSSARQAADSESPFDIVPTLPFTSLNGAGTGNGPSEEDGNVGDDHCKRSVEHAKPLPEGGVDPLKGRRTNGSYFVQYR